MDIIVSVLGNVGAVIVMTTSILYLCDSLAQSRT